jgi:hypothetical protein
MVIFSKITAKQPKGFENVAKEAQAPERIKRHFA